VSGLAVSDIVVVVGLAVVFHSFSGKNVEFPIQYWSVVALGATLFSYATLLQRGYEFDWLLRGREQALVTIASSVAMLLVLTVVLFFSTVADEPSRLCLIGWSAAVAVVLAAERLLVSRFVATRRRAGGFATRLAVVGRDQRSRELVARISEGGSSEVDVCGWFSAAALPGQGRSPERPGESRADDEWHGGGSVDDLIRISRHSPLDEVIVVVPEEPAPEIDDALRKLSSIPVSVGVYPEALLGQRHRHHGLKIVAGVPVLDLHRRPLDGADFFLKRSMDLAISATALVFLFPLLLLIGIVVKLDSRGPAFFKQQRLGFNNNVISVYKFRTMRHETCADPSVPQATRDDPRITRLGRFLRRTSLDELPQLLNVLKGEMSLVGPRPHALEHNEKYAREIDRYLARHRVKPGITGFAQVHGLRGETRDRGKMEMRVEYDLRYIENWSLLLDLKILLQTVLVGFRDPNAY
jgi:Undecaprenyl-phosphate glucose phosphotransferase